MVMKLFGKLYILLFAATTLLLSCGSDDVERFAVAPMGGVNFTPTPGGAIMNYTLPDNSEIQNIRVRYNDVNGKEVVLLGSYLSKQVELVGFNEARNNIPVFISYVDKNGHMSDEYETTFSTDDSGPYAFFENAEVKPAWNGFELSYNLPKEGMKGYAHVFYVGVNPNTGQSDTLFVNTITLGQGKNSQFYSLKQQSEETTVVVKTEDFRGYFVREQVWENIKSYPTIKFDSNKLSITCPKSYEDDTYKLGIQYLTDGDTKGILSCSGSSKEYYTFVMGPYAFGEGLFIDMGSALVPSSVRIYAQMKAKYSYGSPIWISNYSDTLPCDVTVFASNDYQNWEQIGSYSEPADGSGAKWYERDRLVNRYGSLTIEQMEQNDPVSLDIVFGLSDKAYRYLKVVPNQTFDEYYASLKNTQQYVSMQELEVYVKK